MQYVLDCTTTVLSIVFCIYIFGQLQFPKRSDHRSLRIAIVISGIIGKELLILLRIPPLNFISQVLIIILIASILFKCKLKSIMLYTFMLCSIELTADALGVIIVSVANNMTIAETLNVNHLSLQHHLINWILWLIIIRIFCLLAKKDKNLHAQWHEITFYIILSLLECLIFAYISNMISDKSSGIFIIVMMFGFLFIDFSIIIFFHKMSALREKENKLKMMVQKEEMEYQMYRELEIKFQESQEIVHDMNRHLRVLRNAIANEPHIKTEQYISELEDITNQLVSPIHNQNRILEIILNTAYAKCKKNKITFHMDIEDFSLQFLSDTDITVIFSNLLDNAIDACMNLNLDQKCIKIRLNKCLNLMVLEVSNPIPLNYVVELNHSTKAGHMGLGITILTRTAEKYHGAFSWKQENQKYTASITIPLSDT